MDDTKDKQPHLDNETSNDQVSLKQQGHTARLLRTPKINKGKKDHDTITNSTDNGKLALPAVSSPQPLRRSGRRPLPTRRYEPPPPPPPPHPPQATTTAAAAAVETPTKRLPSKKRAAHSPAATTQARRNPKHKSLPTSASSVANLTDELPNDLMREALKPLQPQDFEELEAWVELESDPAFFNIILRDLGVEDIKAQELFTIDQESIDHLPKPIFGLVFLLQYPSDDEETEDAEDAAHVWFANQTVHNACATVALLNIVMNISEAQIGQKLQAFKESTMNLSTALRGLHLSTNTFIRSIHNSFSRRMHHLHADLALENEAAASRRKSKRGGANKAKSPRNTAPRSKNEESDDTYHYLAYVPVGGHVWELDGMKTGPSCIGDIPSDNWTTVARPHIEARMLEQEESHISFNLIALCKSPLVAQSQKIAQAIHSARYVEEALTHHDDTLPNNNNNHDNTENNSSSKSTPINISEFHLSDQDILNAPLPPSITDLIAKTQPFPESQVRELHRQLTSDIESAIREYRTELMLIEEDEQRVKGRKKDYGAALHEWVRKLAEKGVLEEMIRAT